MGQEIVSMKLSLSLSGRGHASKLAVGAGHLSPPFSCSRAPIAVFSLMDIPNSFQVVGAAVSTVAALRQCRVHALLGSRKKEAARTASIKLVGRELGLLPHGTAQIRQIQPVLLFFSGCLFFCFWNCFWIFSLNRFKIV